MPDATDQRPPVAIGHVRFNVTNVGAASRWLAAVGLRPKSYQTASWQYLNCVAARIWS